MAPYIRTKKHRLLQSLKKCGKLNYMYGKVSPHKGKTSFKYNKKDIYNLYWNEKLTLKEIADRFSCTSSNIYCFMKSHGIKRRSRHKSKNDGNCYNYRKLAFETYEHKCSYCGSKKQLHVHHIDKNNKNNNIKNLIILCCSCHYLLHERELREDINKICKLCKKQHNRLRSHFCSASCSKKMWYIKKYKNNND